MITYAPMAEEAIRESDLEIPHSLKVKYGVKDSRIITVKEKYSVPLVA